MLIELSHVYKDYQQDKMVVPVLKDVNLQIAEGEFVAIMGPSGSGKTTLMNLIGCLDLPTSGEFYLDDDDVLKLSEKELANLRLNTIGFVFQNFHLLQKESALENVCLPLVYAGVKKPERQERAAAALARVGLEDRTAFKPTQLSGGQKQRVAIARAMVNGPKILLADEPTGALDSASGKQVLELFQKLNDEGVTVIMITHDANVAAQAKRIVHIVDGMICDDIPNPFMLQEEQDMVEQILSDEMAQSEYMDETSHGEETYESEEPYYGEEAYESEEQYYSGEEQNPEQYYGEEGQPEVYAEEDPAPQEPVAEVPVVDPEEVPEETHEPATESEEIAEESEPTPEETEKDPESMTPEEMARFEERLQQMIKSRAEKEYEREAWEQELAEMERIVDAAIEKQGGSED